jgi:hypothetical protein
MNNVKSLFGGTPINQPSEGAIEECKALLRRAERGEIRAVAFVTVSGEGNVGTGWFKEALTGYPLMAGVAMLQGRLVDHANNEAVTHVDVEDDGA